MLSTNPDRYTRHEVAAPRVVGFLREPLQHADDAHGCRARVRGDILASVNLCALSCVVAKSFDHHLLVVERWSPTKLAADVAGVEDETLGDHAVVVRAEWRNPELVSKL